MLLQKHFNMNKKISFLVLASTIGTLIEWYDFYIFGALTLVISTKFFPKDNPTLALLATLLTLGAGFIVRPIGAIYFGKIGDMIGRRFAFIHTLLYMGGATIAIGLVPTFESIGYAAPLLILFLRLVQGFALGGEHGGASIFIAEHTSPQKRGYWTSWLQASAAAAVALASLVILAVKNSVSESDWNNWAWRLPFLFSFFLVFVSYFIRKKLQESPVFLEMKLRGNDSKKPIYESFFIKNNLKIVLLALLSVCMGAGVMGYSSTVFIQSFMVKYMQLDFNQTNRIIIISSLLPCPFFIFFGWISDKIGRKFLILLSFVLAIFCFKPIYKSLYKITDLSIKKEIVSLRKVFFSKHPSDNSLIVRQSIYFFTDETIQQSEIILHKTSKSNQNIGYKHRIIVSKKNEWKIIILVLCMFLIIAMSYSPISAFLIEMFPSNIRYTSISLPYHLAFGVFGGMSPFISTYLIENALANKQATYYLAGLDYGIVLMSIALAIGLLFLKEKLIFGVDNKSEFSNKILRLSGWLWIILSVLAIYFGIFQIGITKIFSESSVDFVFGLIVTFLISPLFAALLFVFGRFAINGEYDY